MAAPSSVKPLRLEHPVSSPGQRSASGGGIPHIGTANEPASDLEHLRRRRDAGEELPCLSSAYRGSGERLVGADLAGLDLSRADLRGADLSHADLSGARLVGAHLQGTVLHGARLDGCELLGASLCGADLTEASCMRAGFGAADLSEALCLSARFDGATLTGATLTGADLRAASLRGARLVGISLDEVVLDTADLREADLSDIEVGRASFRGADLREARLRGMREYEHADWVGVDIRHSDFCGAWLLRRHILDENYLHEFRSRSRKHELIYFLWWVTSDCGRSVLRWACWTVLLCLLYAVAYRYVELDGAGGSIDTLYFSVVTFTTLGYGDVLPESVPAKMLVASEVVLGYMALGGVMSIVSTKMGSRAGGV
jgi:uncharacterized protein YjbI with pentapeptide repeats